MVQVHAKKFKLNPIFILSVAALETGWGKKVKFNNFFGIKASPLYSYVKLKALIESIRRRFYSGFHSILSANVKLVDLISPTEYNKVVPTGFGWTPSNINVTESALTATVPPLNYLCELPGDASGVRFLGDICYSYPVEPEKYSPFLMTKIEKEVPSYNFAITYSLSQTLSSYQLNLGSRFQRKTVYISAVLEDAASLFLLNSDTVSVVL
ncbi:MAG: glucosaminidase domain-containing protein [Ignavibacteriaceae bacterium]